MIRFNARTLRLLGVVLLPLLLLPSAAGQDCTVCTDVPTKGMISRNRECTVQLVSKGDKCIDRQNWIDNQYCQQSCYDAGRSYEGIVCCHGGEETQRPTASPAQSPTREL